MITWTQSAKSRLEEYLTQIHSALRALGADPAEVKDDMRRHVHEELAASRVDVVTSEDVDRILKRLGPPENPVPETPPTTVSSPPASPDGPKARPRARLLLFLFGVLLPLVTLAIEVTTRMCSSVLFDPIPGWANVLLVASVPLANLLAWWTVRETRRDWLPWVGVTNAFALVISLYYAILFLPLAPFACIAIIYLGWGLLPLSPLISLAAAWRLRVLAGRVQPRAQEGRYPFLLGAATALVALALVEFPTPLTRHWCRQYVEGSPTERRAAVQRLRWIGSERTLLTDSYGATEWVRNNPFGVHLQGRPVDTASARNIYYRVTGRPFNASAPPAYLLRARSWAWAQDFEWDAEQGGTTVGGQFKGLSLAQSRLDGLVDADAGWSYVEWTLEFKNLNRRAREARAQVALPPGGVVSRLTLWVNGEEREAAFAGRGAVRAAYNQVVNVERRDPVLVTSCGPDRVLVQCFPVPPDGGTIKIRLGITAPVQLESPDRALVHWPRFIERNFGVPEETEHSVWIQAPQPLASSVAGLKPDLTRSNTFALHGAIQEGDLHRPASALRLRRDPASVASWVADPHSADGSMVRQSVRQGGSVTPPRLVLVVDGGVTESRFYSEIAAAIERLPEGMEFALLLAQDGVEELVAPTPKANGAFFQAAAARLRRAAGAGGQDNLPALLRAWDLAAEKPGSIVVWVHGPQPVPPEETESLRQRVFWGGVAGGQTAPAIYELQTASGPNRVVEIADLPVEIRSLPRAGGVGADLTRFFTRLRSGETNLELTRDRIPSSAAGPESERGKKGSRHLARLWANDEVTRLVARGQRDAAVALAGLHQLVTPVSGAVVLETKEQFQRAGLEPVKADSVPVVPEPGTVVLLALALGAAAITAWRRRRRVHTQRGQS